MAGTILITAAMLGLTRLGVDTSAGYTVGVLTLLGLGIGLVSPVLVAVSQSSVDVRDIGIATASVSFFRNLGGTVGSAVGVAVLTHRLSDGVYSAYAPLQTTTEQVRAMERSAQTTLAVDFADAASAVFWIAAAVGAVAVVLAALTPALTLGQISEPAVAEPGDQYAAPANSRAAAPTSPAS